VDLILAAEGLVKTFDHGGAEVRAVRGVDVSLAPAEFVSVMGPSGCGKSTLLHLLGGLDRPTEGTIELEGRRVETLSETRWALLRRRSLGFVFQSFNLIHNLTVADNVELPALVAGVSPGEARRRRVELLEDLGIGDKAGLVPTRLSGGEQQRVALARALVNRPALLLADEPTGNLDTAASQEVVSLLRAQRERGQAILMVTHDARVASAADRVITMRDGRVADETRLADGVAPATLVTRLLELEA
jgi:putative ABC transport system ATP-binding protein